MDAWPEAPRLDRDRVEASEPQYNMPLPFGVFFVIVFNGLLLLSIPELIKAPHPDVSSTMYWAMNWLKMVASVATIVCIMPRHPRWIRTAAIFQRWTAISQLLAFGVFWIKPSEDGDQLSFLLLFPATVVLVVLGFGASVYLNRVAARLVE